MLRKLLVGSAHYILGPFGKDSDLRRHGQKIVSRGAKSAKKKKKKKRAAVAVARKLCVLGHRLWVSAEVYDPLHNAHRRQERGWLLKKSEAMEQTNSEEVKLLAQRPGEPKAADGHGRCSVRTRFGSLKATARWFANLVLLRGESAKKKIAAPSARKEGSHHAPSY